MTAYRDPVMTEALLDELVESLVVAYDQDSRAKDHPRLPAQEAVVAVLDQIRRLLFPGYYADEVIPEASRRYHIGTWLCHLHASLTRIIAKALAHDQPAEPWDKVLGNAQAISRAFAAALPSIRTALRADAQAALDGDPAARGIDEVILTYPGFEAITVHRIAHWLHGQSVPYIPRILSEQAHHHTGIDIHPGARVGARFFIDHGTGVVIGETSEIGDDVKIYQGVTLGALSVRRSLAGAKRHPTIEDGVVIYAGATVLGGETVVGRGSVIGGNVWLTSSVAPGTIVLESPKAYELRSREQKPAE